MPIHAKNLVILRIFLFVEFDLVTCYHVNIPKAFNISVLINSFFSLLFSKNKDLFLEPFLF